MQTNKKTEWYGNNADTDIYFTSSPANPEELLTQQDEEYLDNPEDNKVTKESFWETDLKDQPKTKDGYTISYVVRANKESDGTWTLHWDSGVLSGFKEGEDFVFGPSMKNMKSTNISNMTIGESQINEEEIPSFQSLNKFIKLIANNIFTAGMDDPTIEQIDNWDDLFEYWDDMGDLQQYTQSDIIELAKKVGVSKNDINYILDLPQVSHLEKG